MIIGAVFYIFYARLNYHGPIIEMNVVDKVRVEV